MWQQQNNVSSVRRPASLAKLVPTACAQARCRANNLDTLLPYDQVPPWIMRAAIDAAEVLLYVQLHLQLQAGVLLLTLHSMHGAAAAKLAHSSANTTSIVPVSLAMESRGQAS